MIYIFIVVLLLVLLMFYMRRGEKMSILLDRIKLKTPYGGKIWIDSSISLFSRTLSLLLEAGISLLSALGIAMQAVPNKFLKQKMDMLEMSHDFAGRYLNEGFSGGEKKRAEILQLATLEPQIAILDETDSGLDIDALKIVSNGVNTLSGTDLGVLIITHYQRILNYIKPDFVHVMLDGRVVESGSSDLAMKLEEHGYDWIRDKYQESVIKT